MLLQTKNKILPLLCPQRKKGQVRTNQGPNEGETLSVAQNWGDQNLLITAAATEMKTKVFLSV